MPGDINYQRALYPDPKIIVPALGLNAYEDVIRHFTSSSLIQDGIGIRDGSLSVMKGIGGYTISFDPDPAQVSAANRFAAMHVKMLDEERLDSRSRAPRPAARRPRGTRWPGTPSRTMAAPRYGCPDCRSACQWINHRAVTLLHYPPIVALQHADYLHNNTLIRWQRLLDRIGVPDVDLYHSILDVNPIAAPRRAESEYPNDFFPINLTSLFFDDDFRGARLRPLDAGADARSTADAGSPQTLPLLVCGSPTYDPQAPGWFRTRFKDHCPKDPWTGSPSVNMLQAGFVKSGPTARSRRPT